MKTCTNCNKSKTLDKFHKKTGGKDNLRAQCKMCTSNKNKDRYIKKRKQKGHSDRYKTAIRNKELSIENKKKCSTCKQELDLSLFFRGNGTICKSCYKIYYQENKESILEKNRVSYYKNKYGISREELGNCCEICHKEEDLVIDHCHTTGKVRGLLCRQCNAGIGLLKDNIELIKRAWEYLCDSK